MNHYQVNCVGKPHLSMSLCQADERLKLSWEGGDLTSTRSNLNIVWSHYHTNIKARVKLVFNSMAHTTTILKLINSAS